VEYRSIGTTGIKVSSLCLGTMQFGWTADEETSHDVLTRAFEAGINFLDTADIYSRWVEGNPGGISETIIGKWLSSGIVRRDQVVLATKVRGSMSDDPNDEGLSRRHIFHAVEASLRRLQTDYIDLYQLHWPDDDTPMDETLAALDDLVRRGSVRYIGCSNFPAWKLMRALWISDVKQWTSFVSLQPHYNLLHRHEYERELEEVCTVYGLGVLPYSPLAGGLLSGKYKRGESPPHGSRGATSSRIQTLMEKESTWATLTAVEELAQERGCSPSQIALAWLLSRPSITSPIIGPRSLTQLDDNLAAVEIRLDSAELEDLENAGSMDASD
jgi:aryl-alcohol dehydrogenase-like predicted oxidoreductase